jgi:hypothetical protein
LTLRLIRACDRWIPRGSRSVQNPRRCGGRSRAYPCRGAGLPVTPATSVGFVCLEVPTTLPPGMSRSGDAGEHPKISIMNKARPSPREGYRLCRCFACLTHDLVNRASAADSARPPSGIWLGCRAGELGLSTLCRHQSQSLPGCPSWRSRGCPRWSGPSSSSPARPRSAPSTPGSSRRLHPPRRCRARRAERRMGRIPPLGENRDTHRLPQSRPAANGKGGS